MSRSPSSRLRNEDQALHSQLIEPKKTAVATPLMLRYTLLRKALSTNGVVTNLVERPFALITSDLAAVLCSLVEWLVVSSVARTAGVSKV